MSKPSDSFSPRGKFVLVWSRVTFSHLTIIYFCFTVLHFVVQLALQSQALRTNNHAANGLTGLVTNQTALRTGLPILQGSTLKVCTWVPINIKTDDSACSVIWNGTNSTNLSSSVHSSSSSSSSDVPDASDDLQFTSGITSVKSTSTTIRVASTTTSTTTVSTPSTTQTSTTTTTTTVVVVEHSTTDSLIPPSPTLSSFLFPSRIHRTNYDDAAQHDSVIGAPKADMENISIQTRNLSIKSAPNNACQTSLIWPISELRDAEREDIVFMVFQFWVLGVSIVAILNESIPHIIASLVTHLLATAWAGFRIFNTAVFRSEFRRIIVDGTCKGVRLLPDYWDARSKSEIAALVLNIVALVISSFLTWKIIKSFGWQTFKRVGASLVISRVYRLVLILSIAIQLSFFFMATTVCLWIDRLVNSAIGELALFRVLYLVSSCSTLALLIPWLATGWFGVRRELRLPMFFFLFLSILYLGGWGVMFFSTTFRWTFLTWHLFSAMACASVFLTCAAFILGVVCRCNFGKGLHRHLNSSLSDDAGRRGIDIEKLNAPNDEITFSRHLVTSPGPMQAPGQTIDTFVIPSLSSRLAQQHPSDYISVSDASISCSGSITSADSSVEIGRRWVIE